MRKDVYAFAYKLQICRGGVMMSTCFFIGSYTDSNTMAPLLDETIERHIVEYGVTEFVVGQHGRFDQLAAEALRREKRGLLQVTLLASPADRT